MPKVSVIIPTYNRAHLIGESIASVLGQTYTDFEIIVVDDGSTDNTEIVIAQILDSRIVYIKQKNLGRSYARNHALSLARGSYIAFLDSDDLYLPGKLMLQVKYMDENPNIGMIYTSAYCIDLHGSELDERYIASVSGRIYKSIAFFRPVTITLPTVMVRKELFSEAGVFDEEMHRFEDTDMWRRISKITSISAISEFTCKLRTHSDNSLSAQDPEKIISFLEYYSKKILREDVGFGKLMLRRGLGGLYYYYGRALLTVDGWKTSGNRLMLVACLYWPPYAFVYFIYRIYFIARNLYRW